MLSCVRACVYVYMFMCVCVGGGGRVCVCVCVSVSVSVRARAIIVPGTIVNIATMLSDKSTHLQHYKIPAS